MVSQMMLRLKDWQTALNHLQVYLDQLPVAHHPIKTHSDNHELPILS